MPIYGTFFCEAQNTGNVAMALKKVSNFQKKISSTISFTQKFFYLTHTHIHVMMIKDVRRRGCWLEESKVALQIKKFLTQLEIFATNELQKEFPEIGIYIQKGEKNEKNSKKNEKQARQRLLNDLKGPTITRPKTLPFLTCMCLPFFPQFSLQSSPNS